MNIIDDLEKIKKIDKSDMLTLISEFPAQCADAVKIGKSFSPPAEYKDFQNIIFAGMGGSAIGADLVRAYLYDELSIPIVVNRDYDIPGFVNEKTLCFICSYSGNTEETLEAYLLAKKKKAKIIAITTNGKLAELAEKDGIPFVTIPKGFPPRVALGYSFFPPLLALVNLGIIDKKDSEINETVQILNKLKDEMLSVEVKAPENLGKEIARKLVGSIPVVYSAGKHFDAVAVRWRGQFAENSKTLCSVNVFPEMNHNEIMGWENPKDVLKKTMVIMLTDKGEHPRVSKRIKITEDIIKKLGVGVIEVKSQGTGLLARMFSLIYIGDYVSLYLAILNKRDPTPVETITYLKGELAKV